MIALSKQFIVVRFNPAGAYTIDSDFVFPNEIAKACVKATMPPLDAAYASESFQT